MTLKHKLSLFVLLFCLFTGQMLWAQVATADQARVARILNLLNEPYNTDELRYELNQLYATQEEIYQVCLAYPNLDTLQKAHLIEAIYANAGVISESAKEEFWADIRYNVDGFMRTTRLLRESHQKTFLDIGCGAGQKLYTALCEGFDKVYGIEYLQESYDLAKFFLQSFIQKDQVNIIRGDALADGEAYYRTADFLYMYSPMKLDTDMARLYTRAMDLMKENAILLEVRMVYIETLRDTYGYDTPKQSFGFFAVKKLNGKFYYKNIDNPDNWVELKKIN